MSAKRRQYTICEKIAAIDFVKHHSVEETARTFKVDGKQIREWRKQENDIRKVASDQKGNQKRKRLTGAGRRIQSDLLEEKLRAWIVEQRDRRLRVSRKNVQKMAQTLSVELSLPTNFKASNGWLSKFLSRNQFVMRSRTTICQKVPADHQTKLVQFVLYIRQMRMKNDYPLESIYAMDETPVWLESCGSRTIAKKGSSDVPLKSAGHEKVRVTVILTGRGDGVKLKPFIVIPRKRHIAELNNMSDVVIQYNTKSWMDDCLTEEYLKRVVGEFSFTKRLMVWDAFRCHISQTTQSVLRRLRIQTAVIPGGCTGLIQPADVSWNRSQKSRIQNKYDQWQNIGEHSFTKNGNMRPPSFYQLVDWVRESWNAIPNSQISDSMKQCGITNSLDGSEDSQISCFKPGRGCEDGLTQLASSMSELNVAENEVESDCEEDLLAIDCSDDDNISWCDSDESN